MSQHLPALTSKEAERLREIARCETDPYSADLSPNAKRASTDELIKLAYIEVRGRQVAATGRVMKAGECYATALGHEWLKQDIARRSAAAKPLGEFIRDLDLEGLDLTREPDVGREVEL
jgi:hypothetical protein